MTEEKVKNRGWVKNAAIIFLAVMLVLTFFSQTIMNRSLPEVSAQYAQSGAITTRVRGSGKIEATETYEVKLDSSHKVKSVSVKVGDKVEPGTVLFVLAAGDGDELTAAKATLADLQYSYQRALITAGSVDESGDNRAIQRAREKLEAAIAERDANVVSAESITNAKSDLDAATIAYEQAQEKLTAAGGDTSGGGGGGDYSGVTSAQKALESAKTSLEAAKIQYKNEYEFVRALADAAYRKAKNVAAGTSVSDSALRPYAEAISNTFSGKAEALTLSEYFAGNEVERANLYIDGVNIEAAPFSTLLASLPDNTVAGVAKAYENVLSAQKAVDSAQASYDSALNSYYNSMSPDNSALMKKRDEAKRLMENAQKKYDDLNAKKTAYESAKDNVVTCQDTLESAISSQKLESLELQKMRADIAKQQKVVNDLSGSTGTGGEVASEVSGVVKTIGVTAGNTASADTVLASIEVPDRGYSVSFSVTTEQAKKVTVGDSAEITTGYWGGSQMSGTLAGIRPDPQNPQTNKLLVFTLTGDEIESGAQVSVSIGQKSQNYEVIVPNSAVREDSNGSFVLVVVAKSSPLGNRYVATRVDVQVLAKDDTNSAVSGGVSAWDFVITNSTKPIESGMQVRMADA